MYCEGREAGPNEGLLRVAHGVARSGMDEADSLAVKLANGGAGAAGAAAMLERNCFRLNRLAL